MTESHATVIASEGARSGVAPRWVNPLFIVLVVYAAVIAVWLLTGFGGEKVTHYVELLADSPLCLSSLILSVAAARHTPRGLLRTAWIWLSIALTLYFLGAAIASGTWLAGRDPYPGPADIPYLAFY